MSVKFEDSHMQESWKQSTSVTSIHQVQQDRYWAVTTKGQGQHHISLNGINLLCLWIKCTLTKTINFIFEVRHSWIHNNGACCFRRGRLAVQCVGKCSSAPPPSPLICSYIQTPGPTPASTVAKGSTRSLTWRNTPSYTPVCVSFGCFYYVKVRWHHSIIKLSCSFIFQLLLASSTYTYPSLACGFQTNFFPLWCSEGKQVQFKLSGLKYRERK